MPQRHYTQLSYEERVVIAHEVAKMRDKVANINISEIARSLNRNKSTISRELRRNGLAPDNKTTRVNRPRLDARHYKGTELSQRIVISKWEYEKRLKRFRKHSKYRYGAMRAEVLKSNRKKAAMQACHDLKLSTDDLLRRYVCDKLALRWSPEQISLRLKYIYEKPIISHTAIYHYLYSSGEKELIRCLRRRGKAYRHNNPKTIYNQTNRKKHSIHDRPNIVDKLERIGDLEGDTIVGKDKSDRILTHTDRKTGLVSLGLVKNFSAYKITKQTIIDIERVFNNAQTITYDNGVEFTFWKETERKTSATIYFADPYAPYQRGRNENCNGLIRDYLPKGTDFKELNANDIMKIEFLLNNRPRKRLGGKTPQEAYVALKGLT
jgi:IS30 family transposase